MNKRGWTREQIFELVENLYKHHADYGQGKTQDFHTVCLNCKYAAEIITQLLGNCPEREKLIKLLCEAHSKSTEAASFEDATYAKQLRMEADNLISNGVTVQQWISV